MEHKHPIRQESAAVARRLILVRHGNPEPSADTAAAEWRLGPFGVERSRRLATRLPPSSASTVYSSTEPKAIETAHAIGDVLRLPTDVVDGVHEHERPHIRLLNRSDFEARVRRFFSAPSECVFGNESADGAGARFARAIAALTTASATEDVIVVTHGTVITLFLGRTNGIDEFSFWRVLPMPCAVVLTLPSLALETIIDPD